MKYFILGLIFGIVVMIWVNSYLIKVQYEATHWISNFSN